MEARDKRHKRTVTRPDPDAIAPGPPPGLHLRVLGGCDILTPGGPIRFESSKTTGLFVFLALVGGAQSRPKLAGIFWPELAEDRAAAALRRALWDQRRRLGIPSASAVMQVTRSSVAIEPDALVCDAEQFRRAIEASGGKAGGAPGDVSLERLERASELYRGDLLDGFFVDGAPVFEEWLLAERERLRMAALHVLQRLVSGLRERGETVRALGHARRLLALDPWLEEGHRAVSELLALGGQRGAALQQLQACRRILAEELGAAPTRETQELERRLRDEVRLSPQARDAVSDSKSAAGAPTNNLPLPTTPFVGRERELGIVAEKLGDPACRLLTILGPGGVGKTRLALQAVFGLLGGGEQPSVPFPDGVVFVPSSESATSAILAEEIARAFDLAPGGSRDSRMQLLDYLRSRRTLLLLDGFEHRIAEAGLLSALLAAAPELKLLVSSRERLRLDGEWVLELSGLELPGSGAGHVLGRSPAIQLFLKAARRATLDFRVDPRSLTDVAAICRLVEGMPLAIEMAAGWMSTMEPADVAGQIGRSLDFLASPLRHAPADQGSLRAVFDHSFARLSPEEQRALCALTVVAGGISREAAAAIARTEPLLLRSLADRSFLRVEPGSGRYAIHEVLRYYAGERLSRQPEQRELALARHAEHFADLVERHTEAICLRMDGEAVDLVAAEIDNVRVAWNRAVELLDVVLAGRLLPGVTALHLALGWYREGERLVGQAIEALHGADETAERWGPMLGRALVGRSALRNRLGMYRQAAEDLDAALDLLRADDSSVDRAAALFHLGDTALLEGRFADAHARLSSAIELARRCGARLVLAEALGRLGRVVLDQGRHGEARALFRESLTTARELGNQPAVTYAMNQLGFVAYFDGALDEAELLLREALELARATANRAGAALAVQGLGFVAEDRNRLDLASEYHRRGLEISEEHGDRFGAGRNLMLLGEVARKLGQFEEARRYYQESLEVNRTIGSRYICGLLHGNLALVAAAERDAEEGRAQIRAALIEYRATGSFTVALEPLVALAEIAHADGDTGRALALLGLVRSHPANRQDHQLEVERVLAAIRVARPGIDVESGLRSGDRLNLDDVVAQVLEDAS